LSDASGQRTDAYSYDVFGAVRNHAGGSGQPYRFTGEQQDESSLVYLRARYLDPHIGRFISVDGMEGLDWSTQSKNKYVYVVNRPTELTDATGLSYVYSSWRAAGFFGFGGSIEITKYMDTQTGETRVVVTPGLGAGYLGGFTNQTGLSEGSLPDSGFDLRGNLSAEAIAAGAGADATLNLDRKTTSSIGMSAGPIYYQVASDRSRTFAAEVGVSLEASGTLNRRFVIGGWRSGGWLDRLLFFAISPDWTHRTYVESASSWSGGTDFGRPPIK